MKTLKAFIVAIVGAVLLAWLNQVSGSLLWSALILMLIGGLIIGLAYYLGGGD